MVKDIKPLQTVSNGENGEIEFKQIEYNTLETGKEVPHYYIVKEVIPDETKGVKYDTAEHRFKVIVKNDGSGQLKITTDGETYNAEASITELDFRNVYEPASAKLTLGGNKTLENKKLKADEFTFELYETNSDFVIDGKTAVYEAKNAADGKYQFEELSFDAAGTYYYSVVEKAGEYEGIGNGEFVYDDKKYDITVNVTDDLEGQFKIDVIYGGDADVNKQVNAMISDLNFANVYNPEDAEIYISGEKILTGRDAEPGEFTFELYETDDDYRVDNEAVLLQTVSNGEDNSIEFDAVTYETLQVTESEEEYAEHYYVVKEVIPEVTDGVAYDTAEHKIKVTVMNDGEGELKIAVNDGTFGEGTTVISGINFENIYTSTWSGEEEVIIDGQKNLFGDRTEVKNGEFKFVLSEVDADTDGNEVVNVLDTVKNDRDGKFAFDVTKLVNGYTEAGTYFYRVTEEIGDEKGMKYDETVYEVAVTIADDGKGNLIIGNIEYTADGELAAGVEFNNNYSEPEAVKTGDDTTSILLIGYTGIMALLIGIMAAFSGRRRRA